MYRQRMYVCMYVHAYTYTSNVCNMQKKGAMSRQKTKTFPPASLAFFFFPPQAVECGKKSETGRQ